MSAHLKLRDKMKNVELSALKQFMLQQEDKIYTTKSKQKKFTIRLVENRMEVTPQSSGRPRYQSDSGLKKILDYFNKNGSLRPKDYHDVTFNSVYVLTVLEEYLESNQHESK